MHATCTPLLIPSPPRSRHKLDYLDPPLLSRAMLAYTGLRNQPEATFLRAMYTQVTSKLPMFDDEDLATTAQVRAVHPHRVSLASLSTTTTPAAAGGNRSSLCTAPR
jgi:hypothetical protein